MKVLERSRSDRTGNCSHRDNIQLGIRAGYNIMLPSMITHELPQLVPLPALDKDYISVVFV